jgi:hypothetical protein
VFVWSWGRDLEFCTFDGEVSLGRVVVWISYTGMKHIGSTWMRHWVDVC